MSKNAVLLSNLGSPAKPETAEVRTYLNQFLMDPYVIHLPWILRRLIVSLFILPTRPKASAEAYKSVWLDEGSPLVVLSENLKDALQSKMDMPVAMAMRYGEPSLESEILKLSEQGVERIFFISLYPHYAESTVETGIVEAKRVIAKHNLAIQLDVFPAFYQNSKYISSLVASAQPYLEAEYDHLIFSYHGLPESHITKLDSTGQHCLKSSECCFQESPAHKTCYRHQIFRTTELFVQEAKIPKNKYSVAFQSRLGRAKWLEPNLEDLIRQQAEEGKKRLIVICPAFVTDCLETLEEVAIRADEIFREAGGEKLELIPCMNDNEHWVSTLADWSQEYFKRII